MKKRILSILLVAALAAGTLFGCGSVKEETNETTKTIEEGAADAKPIQNRLRSRLLIRVMMVQRKN